MNAEGWKGFGETAVTHSVAHHLMAIATLRDDHGYARVSDVARYLGLTRGSVSLTLKALKERGLVEQDENRFVRLGASARQLVGSIKARQAIARRFFVDVLRVDPSVAEADACKIEHLISREAAAAMLRFMRRYRARRAPAPAFRRAWEQDEGDCAGDLTSCHVCEGSCLLAALGMDGDGV